MTISLIIPCYNEEANIQKGVLDRIGNYTGHKEYFKEVIIVDDGSSDDSAAMIKKEYLKVFPKFRLIENAHAGKGEAVISGIEAAKGEYVLFADIDLATPLEEAEALMKHAGDASPIVIGSRKSARAGAPFLRKVQSVGFIIIRDIFLGLGGLKDTQCGFKMFRRKEALEIIKRLVVFEKNHTVDGSSVSAGFDLEFLYIARLLGYGIAEVPVRWKHVETKNVKFIKDTIETLRDLARIKYYSMTGKYKK